MISDIQQALNSLSALPVPVQSANGMGRIFELYIMTGIAESLQCSGWTVRLLGSDGTPLRNGEPFVQRGGKPTGVAPASRGNLGQSSILIQRSSSAKPWEIWNGIQFRGRSGGLHEFDVSIVPSDLANDLRSLTNGGYPFGKPNVAIECKDVATPGSPDEMRALIARLYDVTLLEGHTYLTGGGQVSQIYPEDCSSPGYLLAHRTFRVANRLTKSALVRTGTFSVGAINMTSHYGISPYAYVSPGSAGAATFFREISNWIDANL
ncbi:hypothetical protein EN837_05555 [bacterium M00.F.Ca.ET.194.01.1.1]|uniref:hypothetical protein n=1 Tax=Agrobacterium pusense TaxID=648995 RepID=UPI0010923899|nr:hypothetical protein [Agrobacterium pusense]TGR70914.1 hypothetical protein EN837_05555 [bacterium M00.F.Ca.ET.194.01.1.1]TGS55766.1 hypothetical protein EN822_05555 [bacterium M00.F.Ca.ET.179.01.1.1]TGV48676.1 hypothetical protein EN811_05555 [bacterium M00.F.Ca.ET.168.01.1.1]